jgi:hypothetical protein
VLLKQRSKLLLQAIEFVLNGLTPSDDLIP